MRKTKPDFSVTLSAALYNHLCAESLRLGVALEWLVAALVADTLEDVGPVHASA